MAYNGTGTYVLIAPQYPFIAGTIIISADMNAVLTDIANALSQVVTRDGQGSPTQNLPMNTHRITGLAAGILPTDAATVGQLQAGGVPFGETVNTGPNTYTLANTPALASLAAGQTIFVSFDASNTGPITLDVDGFGAADVLRLYGPDGQAVTLTANEIYNGRVHILAFDGTAWNILDAAPMMTYLEMVAGGVFTANSSGFPSYVRANLANNKLEFAAVVIDDVVDFPKNQAGTALKFVRSNAAETDFELFALTLANISGGPGASQAFVTAAIAAATVSRGSARKSLDTSNPASGFTVLGHNTLAKGTLSASGVYTATVAGKVRMYGQMTINNVAAGGALVGTVVFNGATNMSYDRIRNYANSGTEKLVMRGEVVKDLAIGDTLEWIPVYGATTPGSAAGESYITVEELLS